MKTLLGKKVSIAFAAFVLGSAVVAGVYLLKMQAGNYEDTKKISVVK